MLQKVTLQSSVETLKTHLSGDDSDFGDGGLGKGVQQLGSVPDDASVLLSGAWG